RDFIRTHSLYFPSLAVAAKPFPLLYVLTVGIGTGVHVEDFAAVFRYQPVVPLANGFDIPPLTIRPIPRPLLDVGAVGSGTFVYVQRLAAYLGSDFILAVA